MPASYSLTSDADDPAEATAGRSRSYAPSRLASRNDSEGDARRGGDGIAGNGAALIWLLVARLDRLLSLIL